MCFLFALVALIKKKLFVCRQPEQTGSDSLRAQRVPLIQSRNNRRSLEFYNRETQELKLFPLLLCLLSTINFLFCVLTLLNAETFVKHHKDGILFSLNAFVWFGLTLLLLIFGYIFDARQINFSQQLGTFGLIIGLTMLVMAITRLLPNMESSKLFANCKAY